MYSEKDIEDLVEMLYPYFIKKYKEDQSFKQTPQIVSAKLVEIYGSQAEVRLADEPGNVSFRVPIITQDSLNKGDYVYLMYWNDLKNAKLIMKG